MSVTPPSLPANFYRAKPESRPIDPHWKCQQSGECCSLPDEVVMTRQERQVLLPHVPDGIRTAWRDVDDKFVALKAQPCPFYIFKECLVYAVRPFNCRRFGCMRPDPKTEPFEMGTQGCSNLWDRVSTSRAARRLYALLQRRSQRWAVQHGWV